MQALSLDEVKLLAPAALAETASNRVSETYSFLPTIRAINALGDEGWQVTEALQMRSRLRNPHFAKHQLAFTHRDLLAKGLDEVPRIYLSNAHDASAKWWMRAGVLRVICTNGMYVSDGLIQAVGIRHSHRTIEEVLETAQAFRANGDKIAAHIGEFKAIELSQAAAIDFAVKALQLRFSGASGIQIDADDILKPQRERDAGNDLWRVFNRVQEWLLKGGFPVYRDSGRDGKARPIKAIDQSTKLNTSLWQLAEQFSLN